MPSESSGLISLWEGEGCVVINKPGGLLTQAPPGIDSVEARFRTWRSSQGDVSHRPYVGLPHRLDRPASGAMILGLDPRTTKGLAAQFERREVVKTYWAVVQGVIEPDHGVWIDYLRKIPDQARSEIVDQDADGAQFARLRYRCLAILSENATLIEIALETGRTHQIRLQAASRGHAIWGDELYGSELSFGQPEDDRRKRWIALHARHFTFTDPVSKRRIQIDAPLFEFWRKWELIEPFLGVHDLPSHSD